MIRFTLCIGEHRIYTPSCAFTPLSWSVLHFVEAQNWCEQLVAAPTWLSWRIAHCAFASRIPALGAPAHCALRIHIPYLGFGCAGALRIRIRICAGCGCAAALRIAHSHPVSW